MKALRRPKGVVAIGGTTLLDLIIYFALAAALLGYILHQG